jgi:carbonic anhydrase/acetyltransferase-like protein (isoleucine patch superfamily)
MTFRGVKPFKTNDTFIAPSASVIGDVTNWDQSSVWYKAVVRADSNHSITIGFSSSVGEGSVVNTLTSSAELDSGLPPDTHIGHFVTIGSGCVLKSCRIDDLVVVGDKCTILEGALVENHVILEAGTVVAPYQRIPSGQKWAGNPATFVAELTPEERESIKGKATKIHETAKEHILEFLPYGYSYVALEDLEKEAGVQARAG